MQLRQVRYFVAIAEEGNLTAAAQRLHISQPPLTRQIQQLEDELGVQLFVRTRRGMDITQAGEAYLDEARQILSHVKLAADRSQAAARGEIGRLEIGYFGACIYSILPKLVRNFYLENIGTSVSLKAMNKREQTDALEDGRIHIGFGRYFHDQAGFTNKTIASEEIVIAMSSLHSLANRKAIKLGHLKNEPMILFPKADRPSFADEVIKTFKDNKLELNVEHEANDLSSAMALTSVGLGICAVPESISSLNWPNVVTRKLYGVSTKTHLSCIYRSDNQSPVLQRFLSSII